MDNLRCLCRATRVIRGNLFVLVTVVLAISSCKSDQGSTTPSLLGINVTGMGSGNGAVLASVGGLSCNVAAGAISGSCYIQYAAGTAVTLTAAAAAGSEFTGWSGGCAGAMVTCQITLTTPENVQAEFTGAAHVTLSMSGNGGGIVSSVPDGISCTSVAGVTSGNCAATFGSAGVVLNATADGQSLFGGWGGGCSGSTPSCSLVASALTEVQATFFAARVLSVTATGTGSGTVGSAPAGINCSVTSGVSTGTCSQGFADGTSVTLTATPAAGSAFAGWTGGCTGTTDPCVVVATASVTAQASFVPLRTLTVGGAGAGAGTVSSAPAGINCSIGAGAATGVCAQAFPDATSVTLTATATSGSSFTGWSGDCTGVVCVLLMTAGHNVTATFAGASSASNTTVSVSPASVSVGAPATVTVTVKDGAGNPVAGATVALSVAVGGPLSFVQPPVTNSSGVTAGTVSATTVGSRAIAAVINGTVTAAQEPALTITAGPASSVSPTGSFATTGARFGQSVSSLPAVVVRDAFGNPVAGNTVTFALVKGRAIIGNGVSTGTSVAVTTDANGVAALSLWSLTSVSTAGNYDPSIDVNNTVTATADGAPGAPLAFTTSVTVSYAADVQAIWNGSCTSSGCHASGGAAPVLAGASRANLTGVYITPGDSTHISNSANRLLYRLITGPPVMPVGYTQLPPNIIGIVRAYIVQGAPNN